MCLSTPCHAGWPKVSQRRLVLNWRGCWGHCVRARARACGRLRFLICLVQRLELALRARMRRAVPAGPAPPATDPSRPLGGPLRTCAGGRCGPAHAVASVRSLQPRRCRPACMPAASIQAVRLWQGWRVCTWLWARSGRGIGCELQCASALAWCLACVPVVALDGGGPCRQPQCGQEDHI